MESSRTKYRPTIGLEIHAELKTSTKMFCNSANEPHESEPNTHVCPVCVGHPGTLPVVNAIAVEHVLKVGAAIGGKLASYTEFDRKNYFYPDIPKSYQISQYEYPLVKGGELCEVAITRVHLEEDTARSTHDTHEGSLIDYNRAGVPLMELVTEPVIHDAETAGRFAKELQLLLRTLGVSDANMEKGEMRIEANISVSENETFGTKVEVKNLNSFKSVASAIEYELMRHIKLLENGEKIVQETRGWDEGRGITFSQRLKETADDYRYFPDPDIPRFDLSRRDAYSLSRIREALPELPDKTRLKYKDLGLTSEQIDIVAFDHRVSGFYKSLAGSGAANEVLQLSANYLVSDVLPQITDDTKLHNDRASAFSVLMGMLIDKRITSRVAKDMLGFVLFNNVDPVTYVTEHGLLQNNSEDALIAIVRAIIGDNPSPVADYRGGKDNALQYLVGLGMRQTKGSSNPEMLKDLFRREISL